MTERQWKTTYDRKPLYLQIKKKETFTFTFINLHCLFFKIIPKEIMFIWHFKWNKLLHRITKEIILKRSMTGGAYLPSEMLIVCHP